MSMEKLNCLKLTNGNPLFLPLLGNDHHGSIFNCKANDKHLVERTFAFGPVGFIYFGKTLLTPVLWVWFVRCKTVAFDKAGFVLVVK